VEFSTATRREAYPTAAAAFVFCRPPQGDTEALYKHMRVMYFDSARLFGAGRSRETDTTKTFGSAE
jgi:hypothetical protein